MYSIKNLQFKKLFPQEFKGCPVLFWNFKALKFLEFLQVLALDGMDLRLLVVDFLSPIPQYKP